MTIAQKIRIELDERDDIFSAHCELRNAAESVKAAEINEIEYAVYVFADGSALPLARHTDYAGNIGEPFDANQSNQIEFSAFGAAHLKFPEVAMRDGFNRDEYCVAKSIADANRLDTVITLRPDGTNDGRAQFSATLGDEIDGGGFDPRAEVTFVIEENGAG